MSEWNKKENKLEKEFSFTTYLDSIDFVTSVAKLSEEMNHHPEIIIGYCSVKITTTTHSAGNIVTGKDIELGNKIDEVYRKEK